jgi:hypothetical protein
MEDISNADTYINNYCLKYINFHGDVIKMFETNTQLKTVCGEKLAVVILDSSPLCSDMTPAGNIFLTP